MFLVNVIPLHQNKKIDRKGELKYVVHDFLCLGVLKRSAKGIAATSCIMTSWP